MENDNLIDMLSGLDRTIFDFISDLEYHFIPVIVKGRYAIEEFKQFDEHNPKHNKVYYKYDDYNEGIAEYVDRTENYYNSVEKYYESVNCVKFRVYRPTKNILNSIYPDKEITSVIDNSFQWCDIYYLGYGELLGKVDRYNMYIGNQCTGGVKENVYMNIMLFFKPKI